MWPFPFGRGLAKTPSADDPELSAWVCLRVCSLCTPRRGVCSGPYDAESSVLGEPQVVFLFYVIFRLQRALSAGNGFWLRCGQIRHGTLPARLWGGGVARGEQVRVRLLLLASDGR